MQPTAATPMQTVPIQISATIGRDLWPLIFASAAGNLIEWYDFFIFGSLISLLSSKFYPPVMELKERPNNLFFGCNGGLYENLLDFGILLGGIEDRLEG